MVVTRFATDFAEPSDFGMLISEQPAHGLAKQVIGERNRSCLCRCRHGVGNTIDVARDDDGSCLNIPNGKRFFTAEGNGSVVNSFNLGDVTSKCHGAIRKVHDEAHPTDGLWLRICHRHCPIAEERVDRRFRSLCIRPSEHD